MPEIEEWNITLRFINCPNRQRGLTNKDIGKIKKKSSDYYDENVEKLLQEKINNIENTQGILWKEIDGYGGKYLISNNGIIKILYKIIYKISIHLNALLGFNSAWIPKKTLKKY
jgi:hypothetical protein